MKKTKIKFLLFFSVLALGLSTSAHAEEPEGPEPPPDPTVPINQAIPVVALLGIVFAYRAFAKEA